MLLAALAVTCARADIELPSPPPPQPIGVTKKVYVGESVEIPLAALTRSGAPLKFLIRKQPQAGTLSEIQLTSRNTATVVYTHDPHAGPGVDRFRYAVQGPDTGVSTPAEVILNVVEPAPEFIAPARLDFPDVAVGESASREIEVRNDGGGVLRGELTMPSPWKVVGDATYSLGHGRSKSFVITFAPTEAKYYESVGTFSHDGGAEIGLGGRGFAAVETVPRKVYLDSENHHEERSGSFTLRNVSGDDRELTLHGPPEILVEEKVKLPARSELPVSLRTKPGFLGALEGKITIEGGDLKLEVPVQVSPAPARLVVQKPAIDFGTLGVNISGRDKLILKNEGGSPVNVTARLPQGVFLYPDPSYQPIPPGGVRECEISYIRSKPGKLNEAVIFETDFATLKVPVRAEVKAAAPSPDAKKVSALEAILNRKYADIPPVEEIRMAPPTKTRIDLFWKKTSPNVEKYVLYLRKVEFNPDGRAVFKTVKLDRVPVRIVRDEARATLNGLRPGEQITIFVVGVDANGAESRPSPPFTMATKPSKPIRIPWTWLALLGIAACVIVIARERRKRRAQEIPEM